GVRTRDSRTHGARWTSGETSFGHRAMPVGRTCLPFATVLSRLLTRLIAAVMNGVKVVSICVHYLLFFNLLRLPLEPLFSTFATLSPQGNEMHLCVCRLYAVDNKNHVRYTTHQHLDAVLC
ncbi:unnamed protein product, partial [Pylaiella littoralis]